LNPGPPPYGVLTTKPQHSASVWDLWSVTAAAL
jgi:hypothetical protein